MEIKSEEDLKNIYRIYEYADSLYFPDMIFPCGRVENYVITGILTEKEMEEILDGSTKNDLEGKTTENV